MYLTKLEGFIGNLLDGVADIQEKLNSFTLFRREEQIQAVDEQNKIYERRSSRKS